MGCVLLLAFFVQNGKIQHSRNDLNRKSSRSESCSMDAPVDELSTFSPLWQWQVTIVCLWKRILIISVRWAKCYWGYANSVLSFRIDCYPSSRYRDAKSIRPRQRAWSNNSLSLYLAGACIKCWDCRSDADPKCADPFDNSTLSITDCKQQPALEHLPGVLPTMCRKVRQKGKIRE